MRRLDKAFQAFFGRVKAGDTPGYPRFKGRNRFDTIEFPSYGDGCRFDGRCVYFQHLGRVKVKLHRPIEGRIKTISLKREADGWYVVFSCDLGDVNVSEASGPAVGIDLGLKAFLVTSEGERIVPPQHYRKVQARTATGTAHGCSTAKRQQAPPKGSVFVAKAASADRQFAAGLPPQDRSRS